MTVVTHCSDIWLSPDDWAEAFEAAEPGTPHNEARDQIRAELFTILMDSCDGDVPAAQFRAAELGDQPAERRAAAAARVAPVPRDPAAVRRRGRMDHRCNSGNTVPRAPVPAVPLVVPSASQATGCS